MLNENTMWWMLSRLLDCGTGDLQCLGGFDYDEIDFDEVLDQIRCCDSKVDVNSVFFWSVDEALNMINEPIKERLELIQEELGQELELLKRDEELHSKGTKEREESDEQIEETDTKLQEIIDLADKIEEYGIREMVIIYCEYMCSDVYWETKYYKDESELLKEYCQPELKEFENLTGFSLYDY